MQPQERIEFAEVIAALAATFSREASEPLLTGYWLGLEDLPLSAVKQGAVRSMRESKFMPSVAELRELSGVLLPAVRAALAWQVVKQAVLSHDYYKSIWFDDPLTAATIANVWRTWMQFCEELEKTDEKWIRKEFERVYCLLASSGRIRHAGVLLGFHEHDNRLHGYEVDPPIKIKCGFDDGLALPAPEPMRLPFELKGVD